MIIGDECETTFSPGSIWCPNSKCRSIINNDQHGMPLMWVISDIMGYGFEDKNRSITCSKCDVEFIIQNWNEDWDEEEFFYADCVCIKSSKV